MRHKTIFIIILSILFMLFTTSCFASDNMMNDIENGIKNTVNGASNTIEGIGGKIDNGVKNIGNSIENMTNGAMESDTNNYNATRTSTTINTANDSFLGMNATVWGWFIMAILGVSIIGVVWFYGKQHEDGYNPNHEDNY